jgi:hypothetical protein
VPARLHALHAANRSAVAGTHCTHCTHRARSINSGCNISSARIRIRIRADARTGAHGAMPQHRHR